MERPEDFKTWLAEKGAAEFGVLLDHLTAAPAKYEFKNYVALIPDAHLDLFLRAESSWKTDVAAHGTALATTTGTMDVTDAVKKFAAHCVFRYRSGRMCARDVVPGVDRCSKHGGALIDPEVRRHILMSSYATIVEGSYAAVEALLDVAENGRSEMARVQAAKELLDRAGLSGEVNLNVRISAEVDAGSILRQRLDSMAGKIIDVVPTPEPVLKIESGDARPED